MQVLLARLDLVARVVPRVHLVVLVFLVLTAYKFRETDDELRDMLDAQV